MLTCSDDGSTGQRAAHRIKWCDSIHARRARSPSRDRRSAMTSPTPSSTSAPPPRSDDSPGGRYDAATLRRFANDLLLRTGVREDIATDVADILVDGDLMEHTTHGLALLPGYLDQLERGAMA